MAPDVKPNLFPFGWLVLAMLSTLPVPTISSCVEGQFTETSPVDGSTTCVACPVGRYSTALTASQSACTACWNPELTEPEAHTTTGSLGSTSVAACGCDPGYGKRATAVVGEPSFIFCDGCVAGQYGPNAPGGVCQNCDSDKVSSALASSCAACPLGEVPSKSNDFCVECDPGYFRGVGDESCRPCEGNQVAPAGSEQCTQCAAGQEPNGGLTACLDCPSGKYAGASDVSCIFCPDGSSTTAGSTPGTHLDACKCDPGKYMFLGSEVPMCQTCQSGSVSNSSSNDCFPCLPGTIVSGLDSCSACPENTYQPSLGGVTCTSCPNSAQTQGQTGAASLSACVCGNGLQATLFEGGAVKACDTACLPGTFSDLSMDVCDTCPGGKYQDSEGAASCVECGPGKFLADTDGSDRTQHSSPDNCLVCPAGKFAENVGTEICSSCPVNKYLGDDATASSLHDSVADCSPCPAGDVAPEGSSSCTSCKVGTTAGSGECAPCDAGRTSFRPLDECTDCPFATYSSYMGSDNTTHHQVCAVCPVHSNTTEKASASVGDCICDNGYLTNDELIDRFSFTRSCNACPADTFASGTGAEALCRSCPAGSSTATKIARDNVADCLCGAGKKQVASSADPSGAECVDCNPGSVSGAESNECTMCPPGKYGSGAGAEECTPCAAGHDQPSAGADHCLGCGNNMFSLEGSALCINCPEHSGHALTLQTSVNACSCAPGRYMNDTAFYGEDGELIYGQCLQCPPGFVSSGGSGGLESCNACEAGRYSDSPGNVECSLCGLGTYVEDAGNSACTSCPPGRYGPEEGASVCPSCADGTYAPEPGASSCNPCDAGFYDHLPGEPSPFCQSCPLDSYGSRAASAPGSVNVESCDCGNGQYLLVAGSGGGDSAGGGGFISSGHQCAACPAGKYANTADRNITYGCDLCPADTHSQFSGNVFVSNCQPCQGGFHSDPGSDSADDCTYGGQAHKLEAPHVDISSHTNPMYEDKLYFQLYSHNLGGRSYCKMFFMGSSHNTHNPSREWLRANGAERNFERYNTLTFEEETGHSHANYTLFCTFEADYYLHPDSPENATVAKSGVVRTDTRSWFGVPIIFDDYCMQTITNTEVTLYLGGVFSAGRGWTLILEEGSPVPTTSQIKAEGSDMGVLEVSAFKNTEVMNYCQSNVTMTSFCHKMMGGDLACPSSHDDDGEGDGGKEGGGGDRRRLDDSPDRPPPSEGGDSEGGDGSPSDEWGSHQGYPFTGFFNYTYSNLKPLTTYNVYYYTEDDEVPAETMEEEFVAYHGLLMRTYKTTCCGFVSLENSNVRTQTFRKSTPSDPVSFEISHLPKSSVTVTISLKKIVQTEEQDCDDSLAADTFSLETSTPFDASEVLSDYVFDYSPTSDLSRSFVASMNTTGCYALQFAFSGPAVQDFGGGSTSLIAAFEVVPFGSEPEPPVMTSAKFLNSGNKVEVSFDKPTDEGQSLNSINKQLFPCSRIFDIVTDDAPMCTFTNSKTVVATLTAQATTVPTDGIILKASRLKSQCDNTLYDCNTWESYSASQEITIDPPSTPLVPLPQLTGPHSIGKCSDIIMNPGGSRNSGGRPFSSFIYSLTASSWENNTALEKFLNEINTLNAGNSQNQLSPLTIPKVNFESGQTYEFVLTLTNFFGNTASSSEFVVAVDSNSVPTISIEGELHRTAKRGARLSLFALATSPVCAGDAPKSIPSSSYAWNVTKDGSPLDSLVSESNDNRFFKLEPWTLEVPATYTFHVKAADSSGLSSSTSVDVSVTRSELVAILSGGNKIVSQLSSATLSASSSYDPDFPSLTWKENNFTYAWSCFESSSTGDYGSDCNGFTPPPTTSSQIVLTSDVLGNLLNGIEGREFTFQLAVSKYDLSTHATRTSSVSTKIEVTQAELPAVEIKPLSSLKVNPSKKLQIKGYVNSHTSHAIEAQWLLATNQFQLNTTALTTTSKVINPTPSGPVTQLIPLVLPKGSLQGGVMYSFKLSGGYVTGPTSFGSSSTGYAEITLTVNTPPIPGSVELDNGSGSTTGVSLETEFRATANSFVDDVDDYPLYYTFLYVLGDLKVTVDNKISDENKRFGIVTNSLSNTRGGILLPPGDDENKTVSIVAIVSDVYDASDFAYTTATVTRPRLTVSELGTRTEELTNKALSEGDVSLVFQVLSSTANVLNSVNCSLAPNCASLSRVDCSEGDVPHTCGGCMDDLVPTIVDDNSVDTQCVQEADSCTNGVEDGEESDVDCGGLECQKCDIGKKCAKNSDCELNSCGEDKKCAYPRKTCQNSCNNRGTCLAYDYNQEIMADASLCTVEDDFCSVKCSCDADFFGKLCQKTKAEQYEVVAQRKSMLRTLSDVKELQDVDTESTSQQVGGIEVLVTNVEELDAEARELSLQLLLDVSTNCLEPQVVVDGSTANSLGNSVSTLMGSTSGENRDGREFKNISGIVDNLLISQIQNQFAGEQGVHLVTDNLKISSKKLTIEGAGGGVLETPGSGEGPIIFLPSEGLENLFDDGCNVGMSFAELGSHSRPDNSTLDTSVSRFGMGCFYEEGGLGSDGTRRLAYPLEPPPITVVLQNMGSSSSTDAGAEGRNRRRVADDSTTGTEADGDADGVITVTCPWDFFGNITTKCPETDEVIISQCHGIKNVTTITCGKSTTTPSCSTTNNPNTPWNDENCVVVGHNDVNITCECDILSLMKSATMPSSSRRRQLNTIYDDQDSAEVGTTSNVDFVGLTKSTFRNFAAVWMLSATLTPAVIAKNFVVFVAMGSVLVISFLLCVRGIHKDRKDRERFVRDKEIEFLTRGSMELEDKYEYIIKKSTPMFIQYMDNLVMNIKTQLSKRHDLSAMFFYYSPMKSRAQRVALLTCTSLGMLFGESVLFDVAFPDHAPGCVSYENMKDCTTPKSFLNVTADNCMWNSTTQYCSFIEPDATMINTVGIAILACIISSPLGVIIVIIFNESIFPPTSGGVRAEEQESAKEENWKNTPRGVADLSWNVYDDEANQNPTQDSIRDFQQRRASEVGPPSTPVNSGLGKAFVKKRKKDGEGGCCGLYKQSEFEKRVEREVKKTVVAVDTRHSELERTVKVLKDQVNAGDLSVTERLNIATAQLDLFRRNWIEAEEGWFKFWRKKNHNKTLQKITTKIRYDLRLTDAIELEFGELDKEMQECRLIEYARMMKLSKIERNIYFQNRLMFESEMHPVKRMKKTVGWTLIVLYAVGTAYYICLFGVQKGPTTTNTWLVCFLLATLQDIFVYMPLKILFLNVYLPGLISRRIDSISNPRNADEYHFSNFMPDNAAVHVAMAHPELDASKLVLSRDSHIKRGNGESDFDDSFDNPMHAGGRGLQRSQTQKQVIDKVSKKRMYYNKGCNKCGLVTFSWFLMLPEFVQLAILDIVIPTAIGSIIYGNYQLYKIREWSPYTVDVGVILLIGGVYFYFRQRRINHRIMKEQKKHVRTFRNSVVVELAGMRRGGGDKKKAKGRSSDPASAKIGENKPGRDDKGNFVGKKGGGKKNLTVTTDLAVNHDSHAML